MNRSGYSLIELVVGMGVTSVALLAVGQLMHMGATDQSNAGLSACLAAKRAYFIGQLGRDVAWGHTLLPANNSALSCINNPGYLGCAMYPTAGTLIQVADASTSPSANGQIIYSPLAGSPLNGFTTSCQPCAGSPSATCPIHLNISYQALGTPATIPVGYYQSAIAPAVGSLLITGAFTSFSNLSGIDVSKYNFQMARVAPLP